MRYKYVSTKYLEYGLQGNWKTSVKPDEDIWNLQNPSLYSKVYFSIQKQDESEPWFYIDSQQIFSLNVKKTDKIADILSDREFDETYFIPVSNMTSSLYSYVKYGTTRYQQYAIGFDCAGTFTSSNPYRDPVDIVPSDTPLIELPDIVISAPRYQVNLSRLHTRALLTVNGFLHQTILSNETDRVVYIKDGGKTANISGTARVGILDFNDIADVQKFALSDLTIVKNPDNNSYYGDITISNIPIDLTNKQFLLSVGGYLFVPTPSLLWADTINSVRFDTSMVDIERKIVEASRYLDLSSLQIQDANLDPETSTIEDLHTDAILGAFFKLPQSFLIVIPKKEYRGFTVPFRRYSDPKKIQTNTAVTDLVRSNTERIIDYYVDKTHQDQSRYGDTFNVMFLENMMPTDVKLPEDYITLTKTFPTLVDKAYDIKDEFFAISYIDP